MTPHPDPVVEAKAWLDQRNLPYTIKTKYQIKIGREVSFFPAKGTIFIDGEERARERTGLRALEEVLIKLGYIQPDKTPTLAPITLRGDL